jgi:predicted DNA-binding protein
MTKARSLLSVRLDPELAENLARYCAQTGATRSQVVQQSMAQYLVAQSGPTLGSLAEALLPPVPQGASPRRARAARQKRFREYVREKRRR